MRQKLGLCCALIRDPDLLILDEPTTGVDPLSRRQLWDLVDRIRAARPEMSVIVATAYMEEPDRFNQLVAMNDGYGKHPTTAERLGSRRARRQRAYGVKSSQIRSHCAHIGTSGKADPNRITVGRLSKPQSSHPNRSAVCL